MPRFARISQPFYHMITREDTLKSFPKLILYGCFVILGLIYGGYRWVSLWGKNPVNLEQPASINLHSGESLSAFADRLQDLHLIDSSLMFRVYVKLFLDY